LGVGWFGLSPEQPARPSESTIRQATAARMDLPFYRPGSAFESDDYGIAKFATTVFPIASAIRW
jgi:hypothetical protein